MASIYASETGIQTASKLTLHHKAVSSELILKINSVHISGYQEP